MTTDLHDEDSNADVNGIYYVKDLEENVNKNSKANYNDNELELDHNDHHDADDDDDDGRCKWGLTQAKPITNMSFIWKAPYPILSIASSTVYVSLLSKHK